MRNLKRALSLVLAAAMLIGMMVVSASAVSYNDFSDREEIVSKDAVSMLTTLGIIEGKPDGSYAPGEGVDRAQMAKMISVIMNQGADNSALYVNSPTGLTDVASHWAVGHINFCYTTGIIAGRGNGTFDPDAGVTAVEAAKMLLVAAGYDPKIEGFEGNDWAINVNARASALGIFRNFTKDVTQPLNRDDAALLIYNALDIEMIEKYENGYALAYADSRTILSAMYGVYKVEGVVVANEWAQLQKTDSDAALREGKTTLDNVIVYDSTTANTTIDEGVREKDPVTFNVTTPVEYMGKTVTLYIEKTTILSNSKVLGVATKDDVNVINFTAATEDTVKDYLKGTGVAVNDETEYYVNYGYMDNEDDAIEWINEYYYNYNAGNHFGLNGIEVQVIDNNDDGTAEYVLYLQETLSEVARYNERNETVAFYTPDRTGTSQVNLKHPSTTDDAVTTVTEDMADVVLTDDVSLEGVVTSENVNLDTEALILYVQYGGRTYIGNPDTVAGKMTRIDRDKNDELFITIDDGDPYYQSYILDAASMVDVDVTRFYIESARTEVGFDTTYDFILDSNGYIVAFRPAEEVETNYALVLESAWTQNALDKSGQVKILMADGTEKKFDINWDDSADAFENITGIDAPGDVAHEDPDGRLELYLGSRDVHNTVGNPNSYQTNRARGSIITYSLNEAGDELTIESVLQGNTFNPIATDDSLEIANVNTSTTAGVSDSKTVIFLDGVQNNQTNLQYTTDGYDNGTGRITVAPSNYEDGDMDLRTGTKNYAVDLNTVAFYWYVADDKGNTDPSDDEIHYGTATGWNKMSDVNARTDVQVYPVLEKVSNATYQASNLAELILFEAEPDTVAADYMLVLNRNAIGKDMLELNVVFEDGTAATIKVDDEGDFKKDRPESYMQAWTYSENADGTYDIGTMWNTWGTADLLIEGTIDLNDGTYLALPSTANVWDVTEVDNGGDDVPTGRFQKNVLVNTVAIVSEGQVRTAWVWDLDDDASAGTGFTFNWDTTGFVDVYGWYGDDWARIEMLRAFADGKNVRFWGDLTLDRDLVIPNGLILQVEGDVKDGTSAASGYNFDITGGGTLRVREDFTVYGSSVDVNTQVGRDLLLGDITTINSRVGVYDDIIGNTIDASETDDVTEGYPLTVSSTGRVFVNDEVNVASVIVDGHLESKNLHIVGGSVNSTSTLIVDGDIHLHGGAGALVIGHTAKGNATVGGRIYGAGDLVVNNGTLTLLRSASVDLTGDVEVYTNGVLSQTMGGSRDLKATTVTISGGEVTLPGTIVANTVTLSGGKLTVTSRPANLVTPIGGQLIIRDGSGTTQPEEPSTQVTFTEMKFAGVDVTLNRDGTVGTVTLPADSSTPANSANKGWTIKTNPSSTTVTVTDDASTPNTIDATNGVYQSGDYIVTVERDGNKVLTCTVTVEVAGAISVGITNTNGVIATFMKDGKETLFHNDSQPTALAGQDFTFTLYPSSAIQIKSVSYTNTALGSESKTLTATGNNVYTIPGEDVSAGLTVTVTAEAKDVNVTDKGSTKTEIAAVIKNNGIYLTTTGTGTISEVARQDAIKAAFAEAYGLNVADVTIGVNGKQVTVSGGGYTVTAEPTIMNPRDLVIGDQQHWIYEMYTELATSTGTDIGLMGRYVDLVEGNYVTYDYTVSAVTGEGYTITVNNPVVLGDVSVPAFADDPNTASLGEVSGHGNSTQFVILAFESSDGDQLFALIGNDDTNPTVTFDGTSYKIIVNWN